MSLTCTFSSPPPRSAHTPMMTRRPTRCPVLAATPLRPAVPQRTTRVRSAKTSCGGGRLGGAWRASTTTTTSQSPRAFDSEKDGWEAAGGRSPRALESTARRERKGEKACVQ